MKVSLKQLRKVVDQMVREAVYSDSSYDDVMLDLDLQEGDPGNGKLLSTLTFSCEASDTYKEKNGFISKSTKVEMYEKQEKMEPVAEVKVTKKLNV